MGVANHSRVTTALLTLSLIAAPALAAVAEVSRHQHKVPWLANQPQHDHAACQAGCQMLGRAAVALPCSNATGSAARSKAASSRVVISGSDSDSENCPCFCCAVAEDLAAHKYGTACGPSTANETAWCHHQRQKCEKECGGASHMDFECKDDGGARAVACACVSESGGTAHVAFRSASGPVCGTPQALPSKQCWLDWADVQPMRHLLQTTTDTSPDGSAQTSTTGNGQAVASTPTGQSVQTLGFPPNIAAAPAAEPNTSPDGSTSTSTTGNGQAVALSPTGASASGPTPTVANAGSQPPGAAAGTIAGAPAPPAANAQPVTPLPPANPTPAPIEGPLTVTDVTVSPAPTPETSAAAPLLAVKAVSLIAAGAALFA